ncbi:MAG: hypothetical protein LBJ70_05125 [Holosporales bacterium]|nr:hypothetical protein [Holosporales bacterium]
MKKRFLGGSKKIVCGLLPLFALSLCEQAGGMMKTSPSSTVKVSMRSLAGSGGARVIAGGVLQLDQEQKGIIDLEISVPSGKQYTYTCLKAETQAKKGFVLRQEASPIFVPFTMEFNGKLLKDGQSMDFERTLQKLEISVEAGAPVGGIPIGEYTCKVTFTLSDKR